ncbi:MAG: hypothetical protein WCX83_00565 [Candidatus Cloacimonas sp.]|nr:hypothetical protein [Candidatus Cloacimonadota bacterium]
MLKLLRNQKGSLGIALAVGLIGILSGVSLSSVAFRDNRSNRMQIDKIQEFHLLRSEVSRARLVLSYYEIQGNVPNLIILPNKLTDVSFGSHKSVYTAKTRVQHTDSDEYGEGYVIKTLLSAFRGERNQQNDDDSRSPVKKYGENFIQSLQSMAIFHYFTDVDEAPDAEAGNIRFYGPDEVHGRTHSNSDIWIRQAGGGNNDGWPTFTGLVTTSGIVRVYPGGGTSYPKDKIFRGGLIEKYPKVQFDPNAKLVRQNGTLPFGGTGRDDAIAYVTMNGSSWKGYLGVIKQSGFRSLTVYDAYPPYDSVGDSIGTNRIPIIDTSWSDTNGNVRGSAFVPMELWISGVAGGRQTWGSSHNIYVKDDITYKGTEKGKKPDNPKQMNTTDYFGLISEQNILIQYGHRDPDTKKRIRPNSDPAGEAHIYMYGAYLASAKGTGTNAAKKDGIVTFQYQFPKGSTPDQKYWLSDECNTCPNSSTGEVVSGSVLNKRNNVVKSKNLRTGRRTSATRDDDEDKDKFEDGDWLTDIDLHMGFYPQTGDKPWDNGVDYPYYNPLWPEPGPIYPKTNEAYAGYNRTQVPDEYVDILPRVVWFRGTIHLYGSIAQRRRGFVRRSGNPDYDAGPEVPWDLDEQLYGMSVGPTGYDKDYNFDKRFEKVGPPDFPLVKFEYGSGGDGYGSSAMDLGYYTIGWYFKSPRENF